MARTPDKCGVCLGETYGVIDGTYRENTYSTKQTPLKKTLRLCVINPLTRIERGMSEGTCVQQNAKIQTNPKNPQAKNETSRPSPSKGGLLFDVAPDKLANDFCQSDGGNRRAAAPIRKNTDKARGATDDNNRECGYVLTAFDALMLTHHIVMNRLYVRHVKLVLVVLLLFGEFKDGLNGIWIGTMKSLKRFRRRQRSLPMGSYDGMFAFTHACAST